AITFTNKAAAEMRERVDRFFVAQHEGLPLSEADEMTIIEANGKAKYGSNKAYKAMLEKIKKGDPKNNPDDLKYIEDNVDIENYFEYIALEMFVGNSDIGNLRCYRLNREGSKWRWIFYDADYGLFNSGFDSPASYLKSKGMGQQKINNTILLKLLSVPKYKDMFLRKLGDIFQTLTTEAMLGVLEPLVEQIKPEMTLHFARWGEENDPAIIAEAPTTADGAYRYWETRVNRLRNVVKKRPNLLWGFIQDAFALSNDQMLEYFGPRPEMPADAV
ncbi:MAG: CotH kinase family protein, partial [Clostridia bacterium]|nr:CotH kinase family protein [Clostridia bacterium]